MKLEGEKGVIRQFLLDCEVKSRTKLTIASYQHHLTKLSCLLETLCQITDVEDIKVIHLRQCVQHLLTQSMPSLKGRYPENGKTLAVSTVRGSVRVWKAFFNWCFQEELIDKNPVTRLALPKPEKRIKPTFTEQHIQKMLAACDTSTTLGFRDYVMVLLFLDTGIRLAEIAGLQVEDVHDTYVKVFGKGRKEREIGIHPEVSKLLWKYIHKYRKPKTESETALFIGYRGKSMGLYGIKEVIERVKNKSGLNDIQLSPHVFRHTFAKMYVQQGGDLLNA